jgi:hypothetical protein
MEMVRWINKGLALQLPLHPVRLKEPELAAKELMPWVRLHCTTAAID